VEYEPIVDWGGQGELGGVDQNNSNEKNGQYMYTHTGYNLISCICQ